MPTNEEVEAQLRAALPESLHEEFDALIEERNEIRDREKWLQDDGDKLEKQVEELQRQVDDADVGTLESALDTVKYWFHDWVYFHRLTHSPREILTIVERAL